MSDERNKARFKFDPGDAREQIDVKPRIAIIDQYFPESEQELRTRALHSISGRGDVEKLLQNNPFKLAMNVPDRLNAGDSEEEGQPQKQPSMNVEVTIDSLERFTPAGIVQQIKQSDAEANQELKAGFLMLDATKQLRAQLGAANRKNAQFVEGLVKRVVQKRRASSATGDGPKTAAASPGGAAQPKAGGFLESLNIKKASDENG